MQNQFQLLGILGLCHTRLYSLTSDPLGWNLSQSPQSEYCSYPPPPLPFFAWNACQSLLASGILSAFFDCLLVPVYCSGWREAQQGCSLEGSQGARDLPIVNQVAKTGEYPLFNDVTPSLKNPGYTPVLVRVLQQPSLNLKLEPCIWNPVHLPLHSIYKCYYQ